VSVALAVLLFVSGNAARADIITFDVSGTFATPGGVSLNLLEEIRFKLGGRPSRMVRFGFRQNRSDQRAEI
jgi:hypothetical protein